MYSGITQGLFPVTKIDRKTGIIFYSVTLNSKLVENLDIGSSINIDGVCQTVTEIKNETVSFAAIVETLHLTTLNALQVNQKVSVERSIRFGDEIGGHLIAGHVVGTAIIEKKIVQENNVTLFLKCPPEWMRYIFPKGFIAVDGSSLTVSEVESEGFSIHLIPETVRVTNLGSKNIGDLINIELDHNTQVIVDTVLQFLKKL